MAIPLNEESVCKQFKEKILLIPLKMKFSCWQLFPLLALPVMAESYPVCPDGEHQASTGAGFFAFRWAFGVFAAEMLEGGHVSHREGVRQGESASRPVIYVSLLDKD
jgi:hypothetical protein